jgi:putative ATP-dependent endonuclease of OLD family
MLFKAYLMAQKNGSPLIIALEEPEAHLHPSAIRSLWKIIKTLPGQKIISTHSGDILSEVPPNSIIRLNKNQGTITAHKLKDAKIDQDNLRKFNYKIKEDRGSLLFARCWIIGEGQTEATIIPATAEKLGYDFEQLGIRVIGCQEGCPISLLLSVANTLGIQWIVLADNDEQGQANIKNARRFLNGRDETKTLFITREKAIEGYLCNNGFLSIYEKLMPDQKWKDIKVDKSDPDYPETITNALSNSKKTQAAMEVVEMMNEKNIPSLIKDVIEAAVQYTKGNML